jgi:hypothetical protein|nr:MAG TPA: terminase small subunit [Caudoviricetes sp.]
MIAERMTPLQAISCGQSKALLVPLCACRESRKPTTWFKTFLSDFHSLGNDSIFRKIPSPSSSASFARKFSETTEKPLTARASYHMNQNSKDSALPLKNARHEKFAQFVADGKTAKEAYKLVYNCKDSTAKRESSKLSTNPLVRARIDFLKAQNAQAAGLSREEKREILAFIARCGKFDGDRIRAIQEDNRMTGEVDDSFKQSHVFNFNIPKTS